MSKLTLGKTNYRRFTQRALLTAVFLGIMAIPASSWAYVGIGYEDSSENMTTAVADAPAQSVSWGADCKATSECPYRGACESYDRYDVNTGSHLGQTGSKCRDETELYNQDQDNNNYYDATIWDHYNDQVGGGTW